MKIRADHTEELTFHLSGIYSKGYPQGYLDPGSPDSAEIEDIEDITVEIKSNGKWISRSIFAGIDKKSPEIKALITNLCELLETDFCDALLSATEE